MAGSTTQNPATRRRVGRPRARPQEGEQPTEEAILEAARGLFSTQGFAATSTRQIAEAAGIRQPTLFHYFPSKKAILKAIIDLAMSPELVFIEAESSRDQGADIALFRYARFVYANLATNPNVLGSPLQFPETSGDDFPEFWAAYDRIYNTLKQHIRAGIRTDLFADVSVEAAAEQLFALIEAPLGRPKQKMAQARKTAEQAATLTLKALLKDTRRIDSIVSEAGPLEI